MVNLLTNPVGPDTTGAKLLPALNTQFQPLYNPHVPACAVSRFPSVGQNSQDSKLGTEEDLATYYAIDDILPSGGDRHEATTCFVKEMQTSSTALGEATIPALRLESLSLSNFNLHRRTRVSL